MRLDTTRLGAWADLPFFRDTLPAIEAALARETRAVLPPPPRIFRALERCQPEAVRVVILGQDPYPTRGHADGLAFSVTAGTTPLPRSLANIFRELAEDTGTVRANGDLGGWADQGVLLLNTALSVAEGAAGSHARIGWQGLTEQVLGRLDDRPRAAILWGRHAQGLRPHLAHPGHLIVASPHPSPLSARRGFFGSRPFSRVNAWLDRPIDWGA